MNTGLCQVCAIEHDASGVRTQMTRDLRHKTGFARAIGTDERMDFTRRKIEAHMIGGAQGPKVLDQRLHAQQGLSHYRARPGQRKPASPLGANSTTASSAQPT